jgi:putative acetyltransferase
MSIEIVDDAPLDDVRTLMREYAAGLPAPVEIPDLEKELARLPHPYAPPDGRLLVARDGDASAGCVAMCRFEAHVGELKRLYVRDAFRGRGVGRALVEAVIATSRAIGYTHLRLDTHRSMNVARTLYGSFGFREIPAYWDHPTPDVVFYELTL